MYRKKILATYIYLYIDQAYTNNIKLDLSIKNLLQIN